MQWRTATELAAAVRTGAVRARDVVEDHLARIERHNPRLNAVVTLDAENARRRADEADAAVARGEPLGPLHGVPVTIKDAFETAGLRTTSSHRPLAHHVPARDATAVARLRAAGAIVLGKTNMSELAMDVQSISPIFGRANNPWALDRTPGGSTGGGAAAVAAGLSPLELGSDIGGSIRIPAHFCGIVGLKPTEHRVSSAGHVPDLPGRARHIRHMGVFGPLARSIDDLELALRIIAGPDGRDWDVAPVPLDAPAPRTLAERRFAWTDDFGGVPVDTDTRRVLADVVRRLEAAGCAATRATPAGFDFLAAWETYGELTLESLAEAPLGLRLGATLASPFYSDVPIQHGLARGAAMLGLRRHGRALTRRDDLLCALEPFLASHDAWLCPVSTTPAYGHRRSGLGRRGDPIDVDGVQIPYWTANISYTSVFNLTGNPVCVVPAGASRDGLPIGIQIVGRRWEDLHVLAVARQLVTLLDPVGPPAGFE
jgi:amidase